MIEDHFKNNPEIERLYRRYQKAPRSHNFAPLADACRKAGLLQEAIDFCQSGLEQHPHYSSGHVVMGKSLFDQGRIEDAHRSFKTVLEMDPENLVALKYLGRIMVEWGDAASAESYFKRILAIDPDNREIREQLYALEDAPADEEVLELTPIAEDDTFEGDKIELGDANLETSDELATVTLADIFASQGYRGKAIKIYEEVLGKDPSNSAVREKLEALTRSRIADSRSAVSSDPALDDSTEPDEASGRWNDEFIDGDAPEEVNSDTARSPAAEAQERRDPSDDPEPSPSATGTEESSDEDDDRPITDEKSLNQFMNWLKNAGK